MASFIIYICLLGTLITASPLHISVVSGRPSTTGLHTLPTDLPVTSSNAGFQGISVSDKKPLNARDDTESDAALHHYYLNCAGSRALTAFCSGHTYGYYCTSKGAVSALYKKEYGCDYACTCGNLYPKTNCVLKLSRVECSVTANGLITDTSNNVLGHVDAAVILDNDTLSLGHTTLASGADLVRRADSNDDTTTSNDFALNCGDEDRKSTMFCQKEPYQYVCDSSGVLSRSRYDSMCQISCVCVNLRPRPAFCVFTVMGNVQCSIAMNGTISDAQSKVLGHINDTTTLPAGTLNIKVPSAAMVPRDESNDDLALHDYALVCYKGVSVDRNRSLNCMKASVGGYSCSSGGQLIYSKSDNWCSKFCGCVNLNPRPKPPPVCMFNSLGSVNCWITPGGEVVDSNMTTLGDINDATIYPNGTMTFDRPSTDLIPRADADQDIALEHDFALVCYVNHVLNKAKTLNCMKGSVAGMTCNGLGTVLYVYFDQWCADHCACHNIKPKPRAPAVCVFTMIGTINCGITANGKVVDTNLKTLGDINNATVYPNGTMVFDQPPYLPSANKTGALHDNGNAGQSSTDTGLEARDVSIQGIESSNDYVMLCDKDRYVTMQCMEKPLQYKCDNKGKVTHSKSNSYCTNVCVCQHLTPVACTYGKCASPVSKVGLDAPAVNSEESEVINTPRDTPTFNGSLEPLAPFVLAVDTNHYTVVCNNPDLEGGWAVLFCKQPPYNYHCTSDGKIKHSTFDASCQYHCECQHLRAVSCVPGSEAQGCKVDLNTRVARDADLQPVDHVNDVIAHQDGTLESSVSNALASRADVEDVQPSTAIPTMIVERDVTTIDDFLPPSGFMRANHVAPASGQPTQGINQYTLNCGNRNDGPQYCQSDDLGFFCNLDGNVVRTSTFHTPSVTWCDNYCKCMHKDPISCVNEMNIPMCQEMRDGTVRDANRTDLVIGYVDSSYVMPNGSLLLDRGQRGVPYFLVYASTAEGDNNNGTNTDDGGD
jgi:hypothetical protein